MSDIQKFERRKKLSLANKYKSIHFHWFLNFLIDISRHVAEEIFGEWLSKGEIVELL